MPNHLTALIGHTPTSIQNLSAPGAGARVILTLIIVGVLFIFVACVRSSRRGDGNG